jgi:hypothetical protein
MPFPARLGLSLGLAAALAAALATKSHALVSFTGTPYTQDFDALPSTGSLAWTNDGVFPGWSLFRRGPDFIPIASITAGAGSSNTGAIYSFGGNGGADRAFGGVGSSNAGYYGSPGNGVVAAWISVGLTNDTQAPIDAINIKFDGEEWRNGGNQTQQTMTLEYGVGATFQTVPAWTAPGGAFDFLSPIATASAAPLDGNADENRKANLGGDVAGLTWGVGEVLWFRWAEVNDAGNDHGLAIDNLAISAGGVTPPLANNSDFNGDAIVDGRDFLIWQQGLGQTGIAPNDKSTGDAQGDGNVNDADLALWQQHFAGPPAAPAATAAPEPASLALVATAALAIICQRPRRRPRRLAAV